jgi:glycine C-acetyltransferase
VAILAKAMRDADLEYRLGHEGQQDLARPRAVGAVA